MGDTSLRWRPRRRARLAALAGSAAVLVIGLAGVVAAGAASPPTQPTAAYVGIASADGMRVSYHLPGFLVAETPVDGGGPTSQATLDTQSNSESFASMPYPGELVVNAGSLVSVLFGTSFPFTWPGYVKAVSPVTPSDSTQDATGAYQLAAKADPSKSTGHAAVEGGAGALVSGTHADSSVELADDGTMTAKAESVVQGLSFGGGALRIGSITTTSKTVYAPGDKAPKTDSNVLIEGMTVLNVPVGVSPDGLVLAGQILPLPADQVLQTLNQGLKDQGISVNALSRTDSTGGRTTYGLEVVATQATPFAGSPKGTTTYRFAQATTGVTLGTNGPRAADVPAATGDAGTGLSSVSGLTESSGAPPALPSLSAPAPAPQSPLRPSIAAPQNALFARDLRGVMRVFYLVLIVGGALGVAASLLGGVKGVRASWID